MSMEIFEDDLPKIKLSPFQTSAVERLLRSTQKHRNEELRDEIERIMLYGNGRQKMWHDNVEKEEQTMECPRCGAPVSVDVVETVTEYEVADARNGLGVKTKRTVTFTCGTVVRADKKSHRIKKVGEGCTP